MNFKVLSNPNHSMILGRQEGDAGEERGEWGKSLTSQGRKTPRGVHPHGLSELMVWRPREPGSAWHSSSRQCLSQQPTSPKHRLVTKWSTTASTEWVCKHCHCRSLLQTVTVTSCVPCHCPTDIPQGLTCLLPPCS